MDDQEIKLLEQISQGVVIFEPYARTSAELTRFQEMARSLLKMEGEGLIYKCYVNEAEIAGSKYYDMVHIPRGLTPEGEDLLAAERAKNP